MVDCYILRFYFFLFRSGLTAIATYFLTKEIWSPGAGLFAAGFIAIVPGYISRSVAGSYDNEGIAIFALQLTYYLWVKSVKTGSVFWASCTALSYFYMVSPYLTEFERTAEQLTMLRAGSTVFFWNFFYRCQHGEVMYSLST